MTTTETRQLTEAEIRAIIDGCEGMTAGPWRVHDGEVDPHRVFVVAYRDSRPYADVCELSNSWKRAKAEYFARLPPEVVRSLALMALESARLREALLSLTNTADGLSFREDAIRNVIGNTNWNGLRAHVDAARAILSAEAHHG